MTLSCHWEHKTLEAAHHTKDRNTTGPHSRQQSNTDGIGQGSIQLTELHGNHYGSLKSSP